MLYCVASKGGTGSKTSIDESRKRDVL